MKLTDGTIATISFIIGLIFGWLNNNAWRNLKSKMKLKQKIKEKNGK